MRKLWILGLLASLALAGCSGSKKSSDDDSDGQPAPSSRFHRDPRRGSPRRGDAPASTPQASQRNTEPTPSGPSDQDKLKEALKALEDADPDKRVRAATDLAELGPRVPDPATAPALAKALDDQYPQVRLGAAKALVSIGSEARPVVAEMLKALKAENMRKNKDAAVRYQIVLALIKVGVDADNVLPTLMDTAGDPDPEIRRASLTALGQAYAKHQEVLAVLIKGLEDKTTGQTAEDALDKLKESVLDALIEVLRGTNPEARPRAAKLVGLLQGKAKKAVPALGAVVKGNEASRKEKVAAAAALASIGADAGEAVPDLLIGVAAQDVPGPAADALIAIGPDASLVPQLIDILSSGERENKRAAAKVLVKIGAPAVLPLSELLRKNDDDTQLQIVEALGEIGPAAKPAYTALEVKYKGFEGNLKAAAARALKKIDPERAARDGIK